MHKKIYYLKKEITALVLCGFFLCLILIEKEFMKIYLKGRDLMDSNSNELFKLLVTFALSAIAILSVVLGITVWLIKKGVSSFESSIKELCTELKEMAKQVNRHDVKIAVIESKLGEIKEN